MLEKISNLVSMGCGKVTNPLIENVYEKQKRETKAKRKTNTKNPY